MERPLPPNWRTAKDADAKEYYFNELTGEVSWVFPEEGDKPKAAPAAAIAQPVEPIAPSVVADADEFAPSEEPPKAQPPNYSSGGKRTMGAGSAGLAATLGHGVLPRVQIIMFCSVVVLVQSIMVMPRASAATVTTGRMLQQASNDTNDSASPSPPTTATPAPAPATDISLCLAPAISSGAAENYALSVGLISFLFCAGYLAVAKFKPMVYNNWVLPKVRGELTIAHLYAIFMAAWWVPAAFILTFIAPFTGTSNAYFATWAAMIAAILLLAKTFARVQVAMKSMSDIKEKANVKTIAGLVMSSAIVFMSSAEFAGTSGEATFALLASAVSTLLASGLFYAVDKAKIGDPAKKALGGFLLILWSLAAVILTFDAPFAGTGNGYFGTWFAFFCALSFAYQEVNGVALPLDAVRSSFAFSPMDDFSAEPSQVHIDPVGGMNVA